MTVAEFEFRDLGVTSPSYFKGAGTAFTDWDEVYVGVGDTEKEAGDDALEQMFTSVDIVPRTAGEEMDAEVATMDDTPSAHADCITCDDIDCDCSTDHDECELQHYCALYVRYAESEASVDLPSTQESDNA